MPRQSIIPDLEAILVPYLAEKAEEFLRIEPDATGSRVPTLPSTKEHKLNVSSIIRDLKLPPTSRQHLYKPEIADRLNAAAKVQGLKGLDVGRTNPDYGSDRADEADARAKLAETKLADCMKILAEREAVILGLRHEVRGLKAQLGLLVETGIVMRTGHL